MIELLLALLLLPALAIGIWERVVRGMSVRAWGVYRLTGLVGTPIHETSHALCCFLFGMRITGMSLYSPNAVDGVLGYVNFRYSPMSLRHSIGLVVQGIAPLITGAVIVAYGLGIFDLAGAPSQGVMGLLVWMYEVALLSVSQLQAQAFSGIEGLLLAGFLLIVSMHAIPSSADVKLGLKGMAMLSVMALVVVLLAELFSNMQLPFTEEGSDIGFQASMWIEEGLWVAVFGAVSVVTLAVLASVVFVLLPAALMNAVAFVRGARGAI